MIMKVFVIFDEQGRIRGAIASMLDNINVRSGTGSHVHSIHRMEVDDLDPKDVPAYVRNLHTNYRIDILGEPKLVSRQS